MSNSSCILLVRKLQPVPGRYLAGVAFLLLLLGGGPVRADGPADGSLPREVLDRVKNATVYVRVTNAEGREMSGSGFIEEGSHKIITNAHVIDMLVSDAKPPRKIEVVRNSGRPGEVTYKATVLAVDQESDLAMLQLEIQPADEKALPTLKVNPAKNLTETQRVYVFGYPLGENLNKNVTVSTSSVSSLLLQPDGQIKRVQVNGGMHHGNSGGPVVDAAGNVVGVAVSAVEGTQLNFAIPGENVHIFSNGRYKVASWSLEAKQRNGGKYYVPVTFTTIDPLNRISKFEAEYWFGDPNHKYPGAEKQPILGQDAGPRRSATVSYSKQRGTVELELTELPPRGKILYFQAVATNGTGKPYWYNAVATYVLAPVDAKPCTITYKPALGQSLTMVQSSGRFKIIEDGQEDTFALNLEAMFNENTAVEGKGTHANLSVKRFSTSTSLNREPIKLPEAFHTATTKDVGRMKLDLTADNMGGLTGKKVDLSMVPEPSKKYLQTIGEQIQQSLETGYIPYPAGELTPGQTLQAKRQLPIDLPRRKESATISVTYTYRGMRLHNGRPMAVFALGGTVDSKAGTSTITGKMSGNAMVDPATGVVIRAHTDTQATVTVRIGSDKFQAKGTLDTNITRGSEVDESRKP